MMDCKQENAAISFVRIECLAIQGALRSILMFAVMVAAIPVIPFMATGLHWRMARELPLWRKLCLMPLWFMKGIGLALASPILAAITTTAETIEMCRAEWDNRWRYGTAKHLDGTAMDIQDDESREGFEADITRGVIIDYNGEARQHGQGII